MSKEDSDYSDSSYESNSDSDNEIETKIDLTKKTPTRLNHAKQFGGYEEDSEIDDSEPDDADQDDDEEEQLGGAIDDELEEGEIKDDAEPDSADDDSDIEIDEDGQAIEKNPLKKSIKIKPTQLIIDDEDEDEDEYEENYLQKFDNEISKNYVYEFHPECLNHNSDEVEKLSSVVRDDNNIIIDPLHKTLPYLTKYEKARVLGQRAKQIEVGSKPFVKVPENIIDSYVIAELELREKKIPFIIKRPIPGGAFEYWHLKDLENINF
jgi:DNA-directed RNA polymerase subunit K/omega